MDFDLPSALVELQDQARQLALTASAGRPFPEDSWLIGFDPEFSRELGELNWIGMTWPQEQGGHGRSRLERFVVYEQLIKHGAPIAASWFADRQIGPTLLRYGSMSQRARWIPDIVSGRSMWCIGLSEPDAGSDVASMRTRATKVAGGWMIDGQKTWTSGALHADWCYLVARTDSDAPKHAGLSEFVLDMGSPGVTVRPIRDMTANEHFCDVALDGVFVPEDCLIGDLNNSFKQVMSQLEHERGGIDRLLSNFALYRDILATKRFDTSNRIMRQKLARVETSYRLGRMMVLREVLGQAPAGYSAVSKTFCTEFETRLANICVEALGSEVMGWSATGSLGARTARAACYSPAYTIMGGTVGILRNISAERLLGLPR